MKNGLLRVLILVSILFSNICFANNVISSVEISKGNSSYDLKINSTEKIKYKKVLEDDNVVYFDIKNASLSNNIETKYNNTSDIKSVVLKKVNSNVRIYIEGKDFNLTPINFKNGIDETKKFNLFANGFNETGAGIILCILTMFLVILAQIKDKYNSYFNKKIYQNQFHNNYKNNIIELPKKLANNVSRRNLTINDYQRQKNPYMADVIAKNELKQPSVSYKKIKSL